MSFRLRPLLRRILIMVLTGVIGVIVIKWFLPPDLDVEHRPTWWLLRNAASSSAPAGYSDFDLAMRNKGEAIIPELVAGLEKEDSRLERPYASIYSHLPDGLKIRLPPPAYAADIRRVAALHLSVFATQAKLVVPHLMNETLSTNFLQRQLALRALGAIGPPAIEARPRLMRLLQDFDGRTRVLAAGALANIDTNSHDAVKVLVAGLDDSNSRIRSEAMEFFGPSRKYEHVFLPSLVEALVYTNTSIMSFLVEQMNQDARAVALPVLLNALESDRQATVIQAISGLEQYGPRAHAAIPGLLMLSGDPALKPRVEQALIEIANPTSAEIPGLIGVLESTNGVARFSAVELLSYTPVDAVAAGPLIRELNLLLEDPSAKMRVFAARALWKISGNITETCRVLTEALDHPDAQIQRYAWLILKEIAATDPLIKVSNRRPE